MEMSEYAYNTIYKRRNLMLKKFLILALTLNTVHILPSHSCPKPGCGVAAVFVVPGIICAWLAYKDFKKGWQAIKEVDHQIKILNDMGVKVYQVSKGEFEFNSFVIKQHYTMEIPSSFSQQQKEKAKEHWSLLLVNEKYANRMLGWPAIGSFILSAIGIAGIVDCINLLRRQCS